MKKKRPSDPNKLAKAVVDITTGKIDEKESELTSKRRDAGMRGALSRKNKLSSARRSEIAEIAAQTRWNKK
jgi:hypothetical protein